MCSSDLLARHSLEDTSLLAPYDGMVTEQLVENHEMVDSGKVVLRYHDIQQLEVTIHVPENEIVRHSLDSSSTAAVSFSALPGKTVQAELLEWSSNADKTIRSYAVTFSFSAPRDFLVLPGMSAFVVRDDSELVQSQITVPLSALCEGSDGSSAVWVYDKASDSIMKRNVQTDAPVSASRVAVSAGLSAGEQVVISGSRLIHENQSIESIVR